MSINISDLKVGDVIVYQAYDNFNSQQMEPVLLERIISVNKKYIRTTTIKVLNIHWQSYLYEQTTYDYFNFKSYCRLITDLEKIKYL